MTVLLLNNLQIILNFIQVSILYLAMKSNQLTSNHRLVFEEKEKLVYTEKNL